MKECGLRNTSELVYEKDSTIREFGRGAHSHVPPALPPGPLNWD